MFSALGQCIYQIVHLFVFLNGLCNIEEFSQYLILQFIWKTLKWPNLKTWVFLFFVFTRQNWINSKKETHYTNILYCGRRGARNCKRNFNILFFNQFQWVLFKQTLSWILYFDIFSCFILCCKNRSWGRKCKWTPDYASTVVLLINSLHLSLETRN